MAKKKVAAFDQILIIQGFNALEDDLYGVESGTWESGDTYWACIEQTSTDETTNQSQVAVFVNYDVTLNGVFNITEKQKGLWVDEDKFLNFTSCTVDRRAEQTLIKARWKRV